MISYRDWILQELKGIKVNSCTEQEQLNRAKTWINSGAPLCRTQKPDVPKLHLVAYFVVQSSLGFLLGAHRNSGLWLPNGGHVEEGEHPRDTVVREFHEELGFRLTKRPGKAKMISITDTVGKTAGHTDVSLWYQVEISPAERILYDRVEFSDMRWYRAEDLPFEQSDPYLAQYIEKIAPGAFNKHQMLSV